MIKIARILSPVDFSEPSRHALDHAIAVAKWYGSSITALYVFDVPRYPGRMGVGPAALTPADREQLLDELRQFVGTERVDEVRIDVMVREGHAVNEILRQAEAMTADFLVMGTHGRSGFERLMLGSVTEKVLRKAACPVLTVPPRTSGAVPVGPILFKQILCPVDFSDASMKGLDYALSLAQEADAHLTVLHVLELPTEQETSRYFIDLAETRRRWELATWERLRTAIPEAARSYCHVEESVLFGKAYREILKLAGERQSELIVIGVHGRGTADRVFFGSTTQHVVRQATCPVLTLRTG